MVDLSNPLGILESVLKRQKMSGLDLRTCRTMRACVSARERSAVVKACDLYVHTYIVAASTHLKRRLQRTTPFLRLAWREAMRDVHASSLQTTARIYSCACTVCACACACARTSIQHACIYTQYAAGARAMRITAQQIETRFVCLFGRESVLDAGVSTVDYTAHYLCFWAGKAPGAWRLHVCMHACFVSPAEG